MIRKFFLIGIGIKKENISEYILKKIKESELIIIDRYTSFFEDYEWLVKKIKKYNKNLIEGNREIIEEKLMRKFTKKYNKISLLVIGDPLFATTHFILVKELKKKGFECEIINNVSILNLIGKIGLSLYKFGKITSLPFLIRDKRIKIKTPIQTIRENDSINAHSLILMDLDPQKKEYLKIEEALEYLLNNNISKNIIVCSKLGWKEEKIIHLKEINQTIIKKIKSLSLKPPFCIIKYSNLSHIEKEFIKDLETI